VARTTDIDWIAIGMRLLRERGHAGLTVTDLCAAARMTKGSLYHHYPSLAAYKEALLAAWREQHTRSVIERSERAPNVAEKTRILDRLALALDSELERAFRDWAAHEAIARRAVHEVDRERIDYMAQLCVEQGEPDRDHARELATVTYALYLGLQQMTGAREHATLLRLVPRLQFVLPRGTDGSHDVAATPDAARPVRAAKARR
jgi:AcrR family transcriptional regulator